MKNKVLLDSSVWIDWFSKGPKMRSYMPLIESSTIVGLPAIVFFEVCKKIAVKINAEVALSTAAFMRQYGSLATTDEIALHAVDLSIEWDLAMADSLVLAHAMREEATLLTLDNDFRTIPGAKVF
jgi:predicted nucleic acid-binding protein